MEQIADRLSLKIHSLDQLQLEKVEQFLESLKIRSEDRAAVQAAALLSEPSLQAVWSNPEDDVYDSI